MKKTRKYEEFPFSGLRDSLRLEAQATAQRLHRSVGRVTCCDLLPCTEYAEEVGFQHDLAERLFYLQHCRNALERSIAAKSATLRYRWPDGSSSRTTFRRAGPTRVKVTGRRPI